MRKRIAPEPETRILYQCACHGAGVTVSAWANLMEGKHGYIEIDLYDMVHDHSPCTRCWRCRLRQIWRALRGRELGASNVMLEPETAKALAEAILELLEASGE